MPPRLHEQMVHACFTARDELERELRHEYAKEAEEDETPAEADERFDHAEGEGRR